MEGAMHLGVRCGNFVSKREKMSTEMQTRARIEIERRKLNEERRKKQIWKKSDVPTWQRHRTRARKKDRKSSEKRERGEGTGSRCMDRNAASAAQGEPLRAAP